MHRIFGAIAIFAAWLSIAVGAVAGLLASEFLGLAYKEGDAPPLAVYGISAAFVLWGFIFAAFLAGFPMAYAIFADDPRRRMRVIAVALAIPGVAMLPDPLGRAFSAPLIVGAACALIGGELIHREFVGLKAHQLGAPTSPDYSSGAPGSIPTGDPAAPMPSAPVDSGPSGPVLTAAAPAAPARGRRAARRSSAAPDRACPWCSATIPANAEICPSCQAVLTESAGIGEIPIPGVTEVQPELRRYLEQTRSGKKRGAFSGVFRGATILPPAGDSPASDTAALLPPSRELKAEMARLDAEIAAGTAAERATDVAPAGVTEAERAAAGAGGEAAGKAKSASKAKAAGKGKGAATPPTPPAEPAP